MMFSFRRMFSIFFSEQMILAALVTSWPISCESPESVISKIDSLSMANMHEDALAIRNEYKNFLSDCENNLADYTIASYRQDFVFGIDAIARSRACGSLDANYARVFTNSYRKLANDSSASTLSAGDSLIKYAYICIDSVKDNASCYSNLADFYMDVSMYDSVIKVCNYAQTLWPQNSRFSILKGDAFSSLHDYASSTKSFGVAIDQCRLGKLSPEECANVALAQTTNYTILEQFDSAVAYSRMAYLASGRQKKYINVMLDAFVLDNAIDSTCYYLKLSILHEYPINWGLLDMCASRTESYVENRTPDDMLREWISDSSIEISPVDILHLYQNGN